MKKPPRPPTLAERKARMLSNPKGRPKAFAREAEDTFHLADEMTIADQIRRLRKLQPRRSKYRNVVTYVGEARFDSKREAAYFEGLLLRYRARQLFFRPLRQVPFHLPGGVRYVVDFLFQDRDGIHFVDVKGHKTATYRLKKKQVEDLYRVTIEEA